MTTFSEIEDSVAQAERRLERRVGEARALAEQGRKAKEQYEREAEIVIACEEATAFLNSFADERQTKVHQQIEDLVTHGIQTIFGDGLTFHVLSEQKSNRTEVSFSLKSTMGDGETVETSILDARGGGVAAVVGFLLRLIITLLREERPLLALDETFAQVSEGYLPAVGSFLREIINKTGVQVLLITHSEIFAEYADVVYKVTQKKGSSEIQRIV